MKCTSGTNAYFGALEAEHDKLRHEMHEIQELLANATQPATSHRARAARALRQFRNDLEKHFAQEESGGYLEEAVSRVPRLNHQVEVLEKQHRPLAERLQAIIGRTEAADGDIDWETIAAEFPRFVSAVLAHEAGEDQVLQEACSEAINLEP